MDYINKMFVNKMQVLNYSIVNSGTIDYREFAVITLKTRKHAKTYDKFVLVCYNNL